LSSFDRDPGSAWSGKTDVDVDTYVLRGIKDWDVDEPASPSLEKRSRQEWRFSVGDLSIREGV
jgi:hypothetical protein